MGYERLTFKSQFSDSNGKPKEALVDDDGHVQIDILSGGGFSGEAVDDGDSNDTDTQGTLIHGVTGVPGTVRAIRTDDDGHTQVDVLSSALPSGAATSANQQTDALTDAELRASAVPVTAAQGTHDNLNANANIQVGDSDVSDTNQVPVKVPGTVDTNNSTTSTLTSESNFTGTFTDITDVSTLVILLRSDQNSAADGATIEWSIDGVTVDRTLRFTYLAAAGGLYFALPREAQFYRVNYTNGGTNQGTMRLEVILHPNAVSPASAPLTTELLDTHAAAIVRSVIAGKRTDGDYANVALDNANRLQVKTIPDLASEGVGRTQVEFSAVNQTADATAYTVNTGKDLVLKVLQISVLNTSTVTQGRLTVKDGGSGGTVKHEFNLPTAVAGTQAPHMHLPISIPEEGWSFGTDVFLDVQGGSLSFSVSGIGYEVDE